MKSIKVTVLGKQYPLKVNDGGEADMHEISAYVDKRFRDFKNRLANQSESTIMTMAALSIAEEFFLEKEKKTQSSDNSEEVLKAVNTSLSEILTDIKRKNTDLDKD
ncbi:MAG: cell division protein ZapA [Balneolales bacterium]